MATPQEMKAKDRKSVAAQTASMMAMMTSSGGARKLSGGKTAMAPKVPVEPPKMAEDFPYIMIPLATVIDPPEDLSTLLKPSGTWLHLVRSGTKSSYFSVSDDEQQVLSLTRGDLPQKIFNAVQWLDGEDDEDNDDPVSVLSIPALYVYALGILRKEGPTVVVVSGPEGIGYKDRKKFSPVSMVEFLKKLAKLDPDRLKAFAKVDADPKKAVYG